MRRTHRSGDRGDLERGAHRHPDRDQAVARQARMSPDDRSAAPDFDISAEFLARSRQYLAYEYPAKISQCLATLPSGALWQRTDTGSNSIGNLLLHLEGNVRQWIISSVGGAPDARQRSAEFAADG